MYCLHQIQHIFVRCFLLCIYINMSYHKFILLIYMCTYVRAYDMQNCWVSETLEDSQRLTTVLASNPAAWASMLQLLLLKQQCSLEMKEPCCRSNSRRQEAGSWNHEDHHWNFSDHDIQDQWWFMPDDVPGCHWKRAMSKPLCLHVEMRSFVASLVYNSKLLILVGICHSLFIACGFGLFTSNLQRQFLHLAACGFMNHEVDSTASTPTSGRLVDLGVWVSQKISQGFDSMLTSCWILLDTRKSGHLSNMELHCFGNQVINVSWTSSPSCKWWMVHF